MLISATGVKGHQLTKATVISCEMMDEAQNDYFHKAKEEQVEPIMVFLEGGACLKTNKTT